MSLSKVNVASALTKSKIVVKETTSVLHKSCQQFSLTESGITFGIKVNRDTVQRLCYFSNNGEY